MIKFKDLTESGWYWISMGEHSDIGLVRVRLLPNNKKRILNQTYYSGQGVENKDEFNCIGPIEAPNFY